MSGSAFASVPMAVQPMNPWQGMTQYNQGIASQLLPQKTQADIAKTQADTALVGQQAIGAGIQNQANALNLGYRNWQYSTVMGGGGAGSYQGDANDIIANGGRMPGQAQPQGQGGGAIGSYSTSTQPAASGDQPAIGGTQGGGQDGGGGGQMSAMPAKFTGSGGIIIPGMAFPIPKMWAPGYFQAQDQPAALAQLQNARTMLLRQRIMQLVDPQTGRVDPDQWNLTVKQAFNDGLIDNNDLMRFYGHANMSGAALNAYVPPEQSPMLAGARAAAEVGPHVQQTALQERAKAGLDMVDVPVLNADGSQSTQRMTREQATDALSGRTPLPQGMTLAPGAAGVIGQTGAQFLGGGNAMSGDEYATRVQGHENAGGNPMAPNASGPGGTATSSAVGNHQFLEQTWLNEVKKYRPDLAANNTDAQLLAMRGNATLSAQMAQRYATDNAPILQKAGIEPNAASLGLAHSFGAEGAIKIANAPMNTPMTTLFPPKMVNGQMVPDPVIAANPSYANMTSGQLITGFVNHFTKTPVDFGNLQGASAQTAGPGAPTAGLTSAPAAGGGTGAVTLGATAPEIPPKLKPTIEQEGKMIDADRDLVSGMQGAAFAAGRSMPVLLDARDRIAESAPGAFGDQRAAVSNFLATFGGPWANNLATWLSGHTIDPKNASNMQDFIKEAFQTTVGAESSAGGNTGASVRIGAMLTNFYAKAMPNINMQGPAIKEMFNFMLVGNQMARDYAEVAAGHFNDQSSAWMQNNIQNRYHGMTWFDQQWDKPDSVNAPQVYEAAAKLLNGKLHGQWTVGLSPDQQNEAIKIATRADSGVHFKREQLE